jgi:hypothetical protein
MLEHNSVVVRYASPVIRLELYTRHRVKMGNKLCALRDIHVERVACNTPSLILLSKPQVEANAALQAI